MKNSTRIFLIIIIIVLMLAVAGSYCYCMVQTYAEGLEDITSDTLVNFNQILNISLTNGTYGNVQVKNENKTISLNGTCNFSTNISFSPISLTQGHKYYLFYNGTSNVYINVSNALWTNEKGIFTSSITVDDYIYMYIFKDSTYNTTFNIYIIDLTLMFGGTVADTITLEQCENYFTSSYYNYNTGTVIPFSADYMAGYTNGVNDTLEAFKYVLNSATIQTSMQPVDFGNYYGEITAYTDYVNISSVSGKLPTGYLPFITPIPQGAHFKINGRVSHNESHGNLNVNICYLQDEQLKILATKSVSGGYANNYSYEFDSPANLNGLYFVLNDDSGTTLSIFNATCEVLNIDYSAVLYSTAANAKAEVEKNYLPGNLGYNTIYQIGYTNGVSAGNAALTSMDYIKSAFITIGEILTIEVFPNVPLGTFFLLPLMVSLIFFVVKLSKGGG